MSRERWISLVSLGLTAALYIWFPPIRRLDRWFWRLSWRGKALWALGWWTAERVYGDVARRFAGASS